MSDFMSTGKILSSQIVFLVDFNYMSVVESK